MLVTAEIACDLLAVLLGCDEDIAVQCRVAVEEGDGPLVLVDNVMTKLGVAAQHLADEAAPGELPPDRVEIDRSASRPPIGRTGTEPACDRSSHLRVSD